MDVKLATYKTYRERIENFMLYGGIKPHQGKIHLSRIVGFYGLFSFIVLFIKVFFFCVTNIGNLFKFTNGLPFMFSFGAMVIKISICLICREDFMILEKKLGEKFEKELKKKENQEVLLQKMSIYTKFMYVVATLLFITLFMYVFVPTINILKYKKYRMIYMGKYPFPMIPGSPTYWVVYIFEFTNAYFFWTVMNGVDNAFGLYCFQTCGLLRLGGQRLKDMQFGDPNNKDILRECVKMHQLVFIARDSLQRAYGVMVVWINITNSIVICILMWQADQLKSVMTPFRALYFVGFVFLKLSQSFTYAYYGSLVSQENANYQEAIYASSWPGSGKVRLMKDLLLILTQRTITLKAFGYFSISMEMFEKIVNTAISYFVMLQTVGKKK